jgi:ferredoxin
MRARKRPLVETIKERCRMCYTCVRECPAKAIRISERQAEVIHARCIGCGNCVRVCSQGAKIPARDIEQLRDLLASPRKVAAIVAPSFPAEFVDDDHTEVIGRIRALGFEVVSEVAFGADLVARAYAKLMAGNPDKQYIATTCPAIVAFVERYHPHLVSTSWRRSSRR